MTFVDNSGLLALLDEHALAKTNCLGDTFRDFARQEAPYLTGALSSGVEDSGATGGGGSCTTTVESTTRGDQGFDYGVIQNDGDDGVSGTLMAAEIDGELRFFRSRAGIPATHWWDNTVQAWSEIVAMCDSG